MAILKLQAPALKQAIDQTSNQTNGYIKAIGACTEAGYGPAGTTMAMLKIQAHALMLAITNRQKNGYVKTIGACTEADHRPGDRKMSMLKLQVPA